MYDQINSILKQNKQLKSIGIFGVAHTHKIYDPDLKLPNRILMKKSIASYLNEDKNSVCKGKVSSIALINYFNSGVDSTYTWMHYFLNDDLKVVRGALGDQKYYMSKTSNIPISPYLKKAFDYIVAINDCHKILTKAWYYFKPTYSEMSEIMKEGKDAKQKDE